MKYAEFKKLVKGLMKDIKDGYYGNEEMIDELWSLFEDLQNTANARWKEIQKLRKQLSTKNRKDTEG